MNFLLDENISPSLCQGLHQLGHSARHVKDVGLLSQMDELIFDFAQKSGEIIITHDLDYSRLLAISGANKPSVILIRIEPLTTLLILNLLSHNLQQIKDDLEQGAIVVFENDQIRVKQLPIIKG